MKFGFDMTGSVLSRSIYAERRSTSKVACMMCPALTSAVLPIIEWLQVQGMCRIGYLGRTEASFNAGILRLLGILNFSACSFLQVADMVWV